MIHVTAIFEDAVIVAGWTSDHDWLVTVADNLTGKSFSKPATNVVFSAMIALATGLGEEPGLDETAKSLYAVVEPWLEGTPPECRPIP